MSLKQHEYNNELLIWDRLGNIITIDPGYYQSPFAKLWVTLGIFNDNGVHRVRHAVCRQECVVHELRVGNEVSEDLSIHWEKVANSDFYRVIQFILIMEHRMSFERID